MQNQNQGKIYENQSEPTKKSNVQNQNQDKIYKDQSECKKNLT